LPPYSYCYHSKVDNSINAVKASFDPQVPLPATVDRRFLRKVLQGLSNYDLVYPAHARYRLADDMKNQLPTFILLQAMDMATTLAALHLGGGELNPLIARLMALGPVAGLLASKTIVIGLASAGAAFGKHRGIRAANLVFSAVVCWNLATVFRLVLTHLQS
jgi:hypothetical protein